MGTKRVYKGYKVYEVYKVRKVQDTTPPSQTTTAIAVWDNTSS